MSAEDHPEAEIVPIAGGAAAEPVDEEPEHGELYEAVSALEKQISRRQERYGALSKKESPEDRDAGARFVSSLEGGGSAAALRKELRDNVYGHLKALAEKTLELVDVEEGTEEEIDELQEDIVAMGTRMAALETAVEGVVIRLLLSQARILAQICAQRYADQDVLVLAHAILDAYAATPKATASADAAPRGDAPQSAPTGAEVQR